MPTKKPPALGPGELGRKWLGWLVVRIAARAFLAELVLWVVRVVVSEFGRHLELLARIKVKLNAEFVSLVVGAGQGEQVPFGKLAGSP